ncbi:MAG: putative immunity protein [Aristaeellaceae bacterium]
MDLTDAYALYRRGNRLLFTRESVCLRDLLARMRQESRRTLVCWALSCAETPAALLAARYPEDDRPGEALELSRRWAEGAVKMPLARRAILQVHAMAREARAPADAALCRAVGQGCSAVHAEDHAIGLALYELTAIVLEEGPERCEAAVEARLAAYAACLADSRRAADDPGRPWASFLMDSRGPNREMLRHERQSVSRL